MILSFRDVHKSYQLGETRVAALKGVNFDVPPGAFMTIVGASGSGKSTLLNLAGTLDDADRGDIRVDGQSVGNLSADEKCRLRSRKMGFIFQSFNLIPVLDVFENAELPILLHSLGAGERRDRVESILVDVGLKELLRHRPDQLSGGQRQRVAIARALVTQPQLVIADEPTASLDSETTHRIIDLLLDLNARRGTTFLFSTHDEKLMGRVTRTVRLKDGLIVDTDSPTP